MDDTDYPEYDPTPYGGGYDAEAVYGKPRSPSEKSCYPPYSPADPRDFHDFRSENDDDDGRASVISAYGVELPDFDEEIRDSLPGSGEDGLSAAFPDRDLKPPQGRQEEFYYDTEFPQYDFDKYYKSGFVDFFKFEDYSQPDIQDEQLYNPSEDITEKVANWLFSSRCI
eukprot:TRINITY_DN5975_c0_g1_i6.p1 TRINITY_DN5975_c0_g1~~TRINITY_DN5975_c0_g1_i6.p1  ORF type:complete len:169 (+),score=16.23 TRINITY_DN5975_c0_g1_i6:187-693(+)